MRINQVWLAVMLAGCKLSATGSLLGHSSSSSPSTPSGSTSTASEMTTMPDLFLKTRADAEAALARAGFQREVILDSSSICGSAVDKKVVELGRVCSQQPGDFF